MSQVPQVPGDINQQDLINATNNAVRELNARDTTQIFKDDTGTRRVLLGKGDNGFHGIKVSQTGNDVYTAADDKLVMSSDFNTFKIVETGTVTLTKAASSLFSTVNVPHSLGVAPIVQAYLNNSTYYAALPFSEFADALLADAGKLLQHIDWVSYTDKIQFRIHTPNSSSPESKYGSAYTVPIKYFLLVETAA
jgi:hypothetical protein